MHSREILLLVSLCCTIITADQNVENVAMGKKYSQSSNYSTQDRSSNAANGNTSGHYDANNCIHTLPEQQGTHWWQVDLGGTYPVYNITVWGRANYWNSLNSRLYPFTITVDGQTCVSVTSAASNREHSVTCSSVMYGRVVRLNVTMPGRMLNLCEFQILVCKEGFYGLDCSTSCDTSCDGGCNRITGHCTRCQPGYHGDQCKSPCSSLSSRCTQCSQDGTCTACTGNFMIPSCTACEDRFYKANDNTCNPCSLTCQRSCDRNRGRCNGCQSGYHGDQCTSPCSSLSSRCTQCSQDGTCRACTEHFMAPSCTGCRDGHYGNVCDMSCSPGCARCDQNSGNCTACDSNSNLVFPGCSECEDGYYKQTAATCIQCPGTCDSNTPCDKTTGHCDECPPGRKGDTCKQACDGGQYGPSRCSLSCGQCQNGAQCDVKTGQCPLCEPGFYSPLCTKACDDNTYEQNCSKSCGQCKGGQPCNTATGSCTTGCEPGYTGELCNDTCEEGLYGAGCNNTCSNCQVNTTCHHQHGQCLVGCAPGFSGNLCDAERTEQPYSTAFIVGVIVGVLFIVVFAAVLIVVISWCRRSREEIEENHQHVVTPVEPESTQDRDRPSSASPISDADTTDYEIIDKDDAEKMHVQENNYESPHPYSNDDADRALYMQLSPPASDEAL